LAYGFLDKNPREIEIRRGFKGEKVLKKLNYMEDSGLRGH
jgi:hypothetical protein